MFFPAVAAGFMASAGLIIAIGAQNAFVLRQGLKREHVALVVVTCASSDLALILLGVCGIGRLVQAHPGILQILRYGGAAFLAVYALMAARRAWIGGTSLSPVGSVPASWKRALLTCLAFTFLNPHVYLDTVVLLGSLSTHYAGTLRWTFAVGACSASVVWFTALGYGARLLLPVFRRPVAWRVLDGLIAAFMLVLCGLLIGHPSS